MDPVSGVQIAYVDLNTEPHLPPDGARTSIPHLHVAYLGGEPVGVLVVSVRRVIDMVYVDPAHRGRGIAGALYAHARERHGPIGTDDRLTATGMAFARRYRVPLYGAERRKATLDAKEHEERGARLLRFAALAVSRSPGGAGPGARANS